MRTCGLLCFQQLNAVENTSFDCVQVVQFSFRIANNDRLR